ncbi:MAG: hypothetical protein OXC82_13805 [Rhodobacteraceae bacterium]|nr:hypothetical protein [Paracoccaceae bacterium]MCY4251492.1 hypothetical protein [Paracoccaceae bacterium]
MPETLLDNAVVTVPGLTGDMGTANAVAGKMRHPEAGLLAIMHGNVHGLEHDITTTPANPEVRQQPCRSNMQPVEPAPGPETSPIHVDDPDTYRRLPDMLPRPVHAEDIVEGPGQMLNRNQLVLAEVDHKCRQVRAVLYRCSDTPGKRGLGFRLAMWACTAMACSNSVQVSLNSCIVASLAASASVTSFVCEKGRRKVMGLH